MRDKTTKDNCQTAAWSSHNFTRNNELGISSSTNLHVYCYQMLNMFFFFQFQLMYQQIVGMNDILQKSVLELSRQDQTQLDSTSESKTNEPITSDAERQLSHMQFKRLY